MIKKALFSLLCALAGFAQAVDLTGSHVVVDNLHSSGSLNPHPGYFRDVTVIQWDTAASGFPSSGILTEIEIPAPGSPSLMASVQLWLVEETNATTHAHETLAYIGSLPVVNGLPIKAENLRLPVKKGHRLALRGNGCDLDHSGYAVGMETLELTRDGTHEAATRRIHWKARIYTGTVGAEPTTTLSNWEGKRILWVGTSIPSHGFWMSPSFAPYPGRVGDKLGAIIDNQATGSSRVTWDGSWYICLGGTKSEYAGAGWPEWDRESFEAKIIGKDHDLVIWDHGHNDMTLPLGDINGTNPATYYGATNRALQAVFADRPTARLVFTTPPTHWTYGGAFVAAAEEIRTANFALAARYGAPVIDLMRLCGFNRHNHALYFPDNVHPSDAACQIIADVITAQLKTLK